MLRDLLVAVTVTVVLGIAVLRMWASYDFPGGDLVAFIGLACAIAIGPLILLRRRREPFIPIAAVYCVVMFFVLLFLEFVISFRRGEVDL